MLARLMIQNVGLLVDAFNKKYFYITGFCDEHLWFLAENLIGKGGFAEVYKGCLPDGRLVAIKQLTKGTLDEKTAGFLNELGIIAHVDHPNTAKLLGCGIDGGMHLVFELSPLGSLGSALHGLVLICIVF